MARIRWGLDRARRERLAALPAEAFSNLIVRRIIVIDREREVREAIIRSWDSRSDSAQKLRNVLTCRQTVTKLSPMTNSCGQKTGIKTTQVIAAVMVPPSRIERESTV